MMSSNSEFDNFFDEIPPDEEVQGRLRMNIATRVRKLLERTKDRFPTHREFAESIGMKESQLSMLLRGDGNPTLKTIAKLEVGFGESIIVVPESKQFVREVAKFKFAFQPPAEAALSEARQRGLQEGVTFVVDTLTTIALFNQKRTAKPQIPNFTLVAHG